MSNTKQCPECKGTGTETREHFVDAIVSVETQHPCSNCGGEGVIQIDAIDALEASIELRLNDIKHLEQRYGTGVRPAWVGEEIGMAWASIQRDRKRLKDLTEGGQ